MISTRILIASMMVIIPLVQEFSLCSNVGTNKVTDGVATKPDMRKYTSVTRATTANLETDQNKGQESKASTIRNFLFNYLQVLLSPLKFVWSLTGNKNSTPPASRKGDEITM